MGTATLSSRSFVVRDRDSLSKCHIQLSPEMCRSRGVVLTNEQRAENVLGRAREKQAAEHRLRHTEG